MKKIELIDEIIKEPLGGAHTFPEETFKNVKKAIINALNQLTNKEKLVNNRIEKFSNMGIVKE